MAIWHSQLYRGASAVELIQLFQDLKKVSWVISSSDPLVAAENQQVLVDVPGSTSDTPGQILSPLSPPFNHKTAEMAIRYNIFPILQKRRHLIAVTPF